MELRIKDLLKEKGMTNIAIAEKVGITRPNMSNIVNGKTKPSLDTLEKIADALNVHISELFEKHTQNDNIIRCPNCGTELELKKKDS
ncbi:helix-turn-helix domain-containing protein [Dysgonomonas capnocytophagoides]|uniref:helix-turn-helix domain-containing protein n=1 Tax=Dysgonomonas capnocytophagoides TaxID=45254 RepID=UPI00333FB301